MSVHESFEELAALATTGDLDAEQFRQLREHLFDCKACREVYADFHAIVEEGFPVLEQRGARWSLPRFGLKRRFADRARKEGIPLRGSRARRVTTWRFLEAVMVTGLMLAGLNYLWQTSRTNSDRQAEAARQIAVLSSRIESLERNSSRTETPATVPPAPSGPVPDGSRERDLAAELARFRNDYDGALADKARLEESVSMLSAELGQLRQDSRAARSESERVQRNLQDAEMALSQANRNLETVRKALAANAATIDEQRERFNQLSATVREQAETIQRDRDLLAVTKEVRELMTTRDLKIVDVEDEGSSKAKSLPGRIFYARGTLIFYAWNLENKGNPSRDVFQVWGKRDGRTQEARSLGTLEIDDSKQGRWVLRVEDPKMLAGIDHVFVTAEPRGGSRRPTGKQLLYAAFLNEA